MKRRPLLPYEFRSRPKTRARETRVVTIEDLEVRAADGDQPPKIVGYPIRYNVWSEDLGGFRERVLSGSCTKTLAEADIRALFNHDPNFVLGRNRAQTLTLADEDKGVRMEAIPPDTTWAADLLVSMRRKDIDQGSFGFKAIRDEWRAPQDATKKDGLWERDLIEIGLYDLSVVTFPAFTQTSLGARSIGEIEGVGIDWPALTALLTRAERGLTLTDSDVDLLNGSIDALRSFLPSAPDPLRAETTPTSPDAGRSVDHLRRLLDIEDSLFAAAA